MSWQSYVDDQLIKTGYVAKGGIYGREDGSLWAASEGFKPSAAEIQSVIAAFNNPADIQANGLYLEGHKFVYLRATPDGSILARSGATGVCCAGTPKTVIIGYYTEGQEAGNCNVTVERLADYLKANGF
ncbi:profilin, required for normal timing of actin polymerization in response to thermal stress [Lobosporangium transversale]|nr:profilin, required for normal timing of actin polymerization in response to thermal stress [Lobosporangium transversale]